MMNYLNTSEPATYNNKQKWNKWIWKWTDNESKISNKLNTKRKANNKVKWEKLIMKIETLRKNKLLKKE